MSGEYTPERYSADHIMQQIGWSGADATDLLQYADDDELQKFIDMCRLEPPEDADPEAVKRMDLLDWIGLFGARKEQERRRDGGEQLTGERR